MAKKVYTPNPVLDVVLPIGFIGVAGYVCWKLYVEGRFFWTLIWMTAAVTVIVYTVEYMLRKFGRWFSHRWLNDSKHGDPLSHKYALKKFVDQGWQFIYHSVLSTWEYILLRKYNWFEGERLFYRIDEEEIVPDSIKLLFIAQISLWFFQAFRHVLINQRKKDYYELFLHHIVTVSLCYVAYNRYYHFGLIILFLHDFSDILVDTLKILNLCKIDGLPDYFLLEGEYVVTIIVWCYQRIYQLPVMFIKQGALVCWNMYSDVPRIEMFKAEWVFWSEGLCLGVLYLLHWYWLILLLRIGIRAFVMDRPHLRKITKDGYEGASDSEPDDEDEKPKKE